MPLTGRGPGDPRACRARGSARAARGVHRPARTHAPRRALRRSRRPPVASDSSIDDAALSATGGSRLRRFHHAMPSRRRGRRRPRGRTNGRSPRGGRGRCDASGLNGISRAARRCVAPCALGGDVVRCGDVRAPRHPLPAHPRLLVDHRHGPGRRRSRGRLRDARPRGRPRARPRRHLAQPPRGPAGWIRHPTPHSAEPVPAPPGDGSCNGCSVDSRCTARGVAEVVRTIYSS